MLESEAKSDIRNSSRYHQRHWQKPGPTLRTALSLMFVISLLTLRLLDLLLMLLIIIFRLDNFDVG